MIKNKTGLRHEEALHRRENKCTININKKEIHLILLVTREMQCKTSGNHFKSITVTKTEKLGCILNFENVIQQEASHTADGNVDTHSLVGNFLVYLKCTNF